VRGFDNADARRFERGTDERGVLGRELKVYRIRAVAQRAIEYFYGVRHDRR
jgi:hypothetical protein